MARFEFALVVLFVWGCQAQSGTPGTLRFPPDAVDKGAVCLDGTPGGYYLRSGAGLGINKWIFHFQGGAWCYDLADCVGRSATTLGSSREWEPTLALGGLMSDDPLINPDFFDWNVVFFRYCDGGSFSGDAVEPVIFNSTAIFFRGRWILDAILEDLFDNFALRFASDLIVTGCSAGGLAVSSQLDYIASRVPQNVRVSGMVDGGYFVDIQPLPTSGLGYFGDLLRGTFELQQVSVNAACMASFPEDERWRCWLSPVISGFIETPQFIFHSAFDVWQLDCHLGLGCRSLDCNIQQLIDRQRFYVDFVKQLSPVTDKPENGAFISTCFTHCQVNLDGWWVQSPVFGLSAAEVFTNWYLGASDNTVYDSTCSQIECFSPDQQVNCDV